MAQTVAEELGGIPMSPALQATLLCAREYAGGQMHREVTLEHLLLALTEDDDATSVMQACHLDLGRLRNDLAGYLGDLGDRVNAGTAPSISAALTRILKYATLAAKQGRRPKIDGAIVLAAIVGDGKSMAAGFLKAQGLTFEEAVRVLQQSIRDGGGHAPAQPSEQPPVASVPLPVTASVGSPVPSGMPAAVSQVLPPQRDASAGPGASRSPNTDDILAAARQRVMSRSPLPSFHDEPIADIVTQPTSERPAGDRISLSEPPAAPTMQPTAPVTHPGAPASASWAPPPLPNAQASDTPHRPPLPPLPPLMPLGASRPPSPTPPWSGAPQPPVVPPWSPPVDRQTPPPPQQSPPMLSPKLRTGPQLPHAPAIPANAGPHAGGAPVAPLPPGPLPSQSLGPQQAPYMQGAFPHAHQPSQAAIEPSHISHNIPERMAVGQTRTIEVQVRRTPLAGPGTNSRPAPERRDIVTARAISVRLRPAKGRFIIDQPSLETQWDKAVDGTRLAADAAVWRFTVQPMSLGKSEMTLSVSARTIAADGMIVETTLPDQVFEVRTRRNWSRTVTYVGTLILVAAAGIVVASFADVLGMKKLATLVFK